jgi:predicted nicotinamide N-methyase
MVVYERPAAPFSWSAAWQHYQYYFSLPWLPACSHEMPAHATGIPDDVLRRVELRGRDSSRVDCQSFEIEQVIGGVDTGSVLWSGSVILAEYIRTSGIAAGDSVLELGAGLGLVSIVASCLGASVVATDGDEAILPVLQRNALRNLDSSHVPLNVRQLWWGDAPAARALGSFDMIVGSDLVYGSDSVVGPVAREASFAALLCTMWLLSDDGTTLVLAYRERKSIERLFFSKLWEHFEPAGEPAEVVQLAGSSGVEIFTFRRKRRNGDEQAPPYCIGV